MGPTGRPRDRSLLADGYLLLDYNEASVPPPVGVQAAIAGQLASLNRYPDVTTMKLRTRLSQRLGIRGESLTFGCGSLGLLHALFSVVGQVGGTIAYFEPSFVEYPRIALASGCIPLVLPEPSSQLLARCSEIQGAVVLANPDNPTGRWFSLPTLRAVAEAIPPTTLLILDEAYVEFVEGLWPKSTLGLAAEFPNVVVLRTFSKAFGLAGLRVGYGIMSERVAGQVMSTQLNFAVNSIAEAAACACLDSECETEFAARLAMVADARRQLILQASSYFEALPDTPTPFVWARTFGPSRRIFEHLERDKILVAVADDRHLRITVPDRDGLARLISSLAGTAS